MICQNCENEVTETALFCGHCGEMTPPPTEVGIKNLKWYMQNNSGKDSALGVGTEMALTDTRPSFTEWGRVFIAHLAQGPFRNCLLSIRTCFNNVLSIRKDSNQRNPQLDQLRTNETEVDRSTVARRSKLFQDVSMRSGLSQSREENIAASQLEIASLDRMVADAQARKVELEGHIARITKDHI